MLSLFDVTLILLAILELQIFHTGTLLKELYCLNFFIRKYYFPLKYEYKILKYCIYEEVKVMVK